MPDTFEKLIAAIHEELKIPAVYATERKLVLQSECMNPVSAGTDIFEREAFMEEMALAAWRRMRTAALQDGVELQLVSAYRSVEYQKQLFLKKLKAGQRIDEILKVNAAPGYSEHHSGRALDLTCPDSACLEESFEDTAAFGWLESHAANYGFFMSFPRNNVHGLLYEPWHWCFND
ncbi:MAG: M15 family metallopeptidase [Pseudohongiellaceae bacterium]